MNNKGEGGKLELGCLSLISVSLTNFKFINTNVEFVLLSDIPLKSPGNN